MEERKTQASHRYTFLYPQNLAVQVVAQRPRVADARYCLSVAAAYTKLETDESLDLMVCQGHTWQAKPEVGFLTGMLTISGDTLTIGRVAAGQLPLPQMGRAAYGQGTVLLQELLVFEGKNQRQAGGSLFQRRAQVELANHRFAMVESVSDMLGMQQFVSD